MKSSSNLSCHRPPPVQRIAGRVPGAAPPPELEAVPESEQVHADNIIDRLREKMKQDYGSGETLRDAHPKMHGCVEAEFSIRSDLDEALRVGLFSEAKTYQAWARLSNTSGSAMADSKKDIRGLAIKLLDVDGRKLLDSERSCPTCDFLLISHPTFLTENVAEFDGLVGALCGGVWAKLGFFLTHFGVAINTLRALKQTSNLLTLPYFSAVPYLFGNRAAKYSLKPRTTSDSRPVDDDDADYLRTRLVKDLQGGDVTFDFAIQFQQDPKAQPVEDPTVNWNTPFQNLATLTLRQGTFDTAKRREFGENLSFNPWRCLAEHRPLGGINRARRRIYTTLSSFRHERNGVELEEPGGGNSRSRAAGTRGAGRRLESSALRLGSAGDATGLGVACIRDSRSDTRTAGYRATRAAALFEAGRRGCFRLLEQ